MATETIEQIKDRIEQVTPDETQQQLESGDAVLSIPATRSTARTPASRATTTHPLARAPARLGPRTSPRPSSRPRVTAPSA